MRRKKQFRKIEWALRNLHGRKKKKLKNLIGKILAFVMSIWLKQFPRYSNNSEENLRKMKKKRQLKILKWTIENSMGKKKEEYEKLFSKIVAKAEPIRQETFPKQNEHEEIELSQVPCLKDSTINYFDNAGFLYTKSSSYKDTLYLRCKHAEAHGCSARAIVRNHAFDKVVLKEGHNHECERKELDKAIFSKTLERICVENPFLAPLKCYALAKSELKGKIKRKHIPMPNYYSSFIHRSKKIKEPLLPKTIAEFEKLIEEAKNWKRYAYDDDEKIFFRGVWRGISGDNLAFISERTLQKVKKLDKIELLMDGTFKAKPSHIPFRQLYIINVIISGRCYPLGFILMEKKDFDSYMLVFNELNKLIPAMKVVNCMTDYEAATRKAIKIQYPNARISGCYFHYVQAISKQFRRFGFKKEKHIEKYEDAINKVAALALLPNEFVALGFDSISKHFKNSKKWDRFKLYWKRQWAKANISVYGLKHRTNNFSESLNRNINLLIERKNPNIWKLIHNLKIVEMLKSDELEQVGDCAILKKERKKKMKRLNSKIKAATKEFDLTQDIDTFLETVTFNENLGNIFIKHTETGDECDEDFDENIIANDYDSRSDFRQNHQRKAAKKRKAPSNNEVARKQKKM